MRIFYFEKEAQKSKHLARRREQALIIIHIIIIITAQLTACLPLLMANINAKRQKLLLLKWYLKA